MDASARQWLGGSLIAFAVIAYILVIAFGDWKEVSSSSRVSPSGASSSRVSVYKVDIPAWQTAAVLALFVAGLVLLMIPSRRADP